MIVFDIETAPLPWHLIEKTVPPFDEEAAVPHPGEFDPSTVKFGRLSDPAKIEAKMKEARDKYVGLVNGLARARADARNKWQAGMMEKAALSAVTGTVKAIGMWNTASPVKTIVAVDPLGSSEVQGDVYETPSIYFSYPTERELLNWFWQAWRASSTVWVGHNIHGFDLPFLIRRSWAAGLSIPQGVLQQGGRYFTNQLVDTMAIWNCGGREPIKLQTISLFFGGQEKPSDCTGADFARLFDNGGEDRLAALRYLAGDLAMTAHVAESMGII